MKWLLSNGAWYLWQALDDVDGWEVDGYTAVYKKKFHMWIASGSWFFDGRNSDNTPKFLGYVERHIVWQKFKKLKSKKVAVNLAKLMMGAK